LGEANRLSAVAAAAQIADGKLTAETLTRDCLSRIAAREGEVQAWEHLDAEQALAQARALDKAGRKGLLHGLPVGVKDVLDTADMPTLWGDGTIYAGRRPTRDAPVVQRLREEGAVILGKTAISRFGFWFAGKTRNPLDLTRSPGSSSSGSAAAVADFMCPLAIGTQTVGSIMRPASFCGLVGVKPTHDWLPWRYGRDYAQTLDVVGGLTRSVEDGIFLMRGLTGRAEYDHRARHDGPLTVGLYRTADWAKAPDYVHRVYEDAAKRLGAAGIKLREVALPAAYDALAELIEVVVEYESARSFEWELAHYRDRIHEGVRAILEEGLRCPRARYLDALDRGAACREAFARDIGDVDLLMVPGIQGEATPVADTGQNPFIGMWTFLHVPDVAVPAGKGPRGLPVDVQLIGRRGDDARHLIRARRIEEILQ